MMIVDEMKKQALTPTEVRFTCLDMRGTVDCPIALLCSFYSISNVPAGKEFMLT